MGARVAAWSAWRRAVVGVVLLCCWLSLLLPAGASLCQR
jgi:hypothetical protein